VFIVIEKTLMILGWTIIRVFLSWFQTYYAKYETNISRNIWVILSHEKNVAYGQTDRQADGRTGGWTDSKCNYYRAPRHI